MRRLIRWLDKHPEAAVVGLYALIAALMALLAGTPPQ